MKIRSGFVSNSSSSSFCIFGWREEEIEHAGFESIYTFIKEVKSKHGITLTYSCTPEEYDVVGVGNTDSEFDHYMEDWESYRCDPPSQDEQEIAKNLAMKLNLPTPDWYSATWFNG